MVALAVKGRYKQGEEEGDEEEVEDERKTKE